MGFSLIFHVPQKTVTFLTSTKCLVVVVAWSSLNIMSEAVVGLTRLIEAGLTEVLTPPLEPL